MSNKKQRLRAQKEKQDREKKELEDYLNRNGLKLKFFLREAVLEKMKAVNGNRNPD